MDCYYLYFRGASGNIFYITKKEKRINPDIIITFIYIIFIYIMDNLCDDIKFYIWSFDPLHRENLKKVTTELIKKCVQRNVSDYRDDICETCLHENLHKHYNDDDFWKNRGWCNVKCGSLNWPHACDFCIICDCDKKWCSC